MRADGSSPVSEALEELQRGEWLSDPDHADGEPWPDERQVDDRLKLLSLIRYMADHGEPASSTSMNLLVDGIWEFKVGGKRIPFFDTAGDGACTPKPRVASKEDAVPGSMYWWIPEFDDYLRLTHLFGKDAQRTRPEELAHARKIRGEDLSHDAT